MMKRRIALVLVCVWLGGCRVGVGGLMRELTGPSRGELADDAFSGKKSPDEQRMAIDDMVGRYWGLDRMPLAGYALLAADGGTDPTVRSAALRALGMARQKAAVFIDRIVAALKTGPDNVRWDAAVVLDRVIGAKAVGPLRMAAARDGDVDVRIAAVTALRHYRTSSAAALLVAAMKDDPDYSVRRRAHKSLVEIAGRDFGPAAKDWQPMTRHIPPRATAAAPWWDIFRMTVKAKDAKGSSDAGA